MTKKAIKKSELDNTLVVDGTVYNINAVAAEHSKSADEATRAIAAESADQASKLTTNAGDSNTPVYFKNGVPEACTALDLNTTGNAATANKVNKSLNIYEYSDHNTIEPVKKFTGETEQTIRIVPATGGGFQGPVTISTVDSSKYEKPELAILNRGQMENMVGGLTGSPLYAWDGTTLKAQTAADNTFLKINTVVGSTANYEVFKSHESQPAAYLYICSDGSNDVYLNAPGYSNKKLVLGDNSVEQLIVDITNNRNIINNIINGNQSVGNANNLKVGTEYKDYSYFQKKITLSPNLPSGGTAGDIWIKY